MNEKSILTRTGVRNLSAVRWLRWSASFIFCIWFPLSDVMLDFFQYFDWPQKNKFIERKIHNNYFYLFRFCISIYNFNPPYIHTCMCLLRKMDFEIFYLIGIRFSFCYAEDKKWQYISE